MSDNETKDTRKYLVRKNGEFSLVVEAQDSISAVQAAEKTPQDQWEVAWSPYEAEYADGATPGGVDEDK